MVTEVLKRFAEQSSVKCEYSPKFDKHIKKIKDQVFLNKTLVMMSRICENPYIGERKHGKLKDVYSYKFFYVRTQYIISYQIIKDQTENHKGIEFIDLADHGDDYKALERYVITSKRNKKGD